MKKPEFFYGWVLVGLTFTALAIVYGLRFSFSVYYVAILGEFGWARAETAGIFSLNVLVYGTLVPLVGTMVDRFGPRVILPLGVAILGLGTAALGSAHALWQFYLLFGVIVAFGTAMAGFVPYSAMLTNWFVRRRGTALGFAMAGNGVSFLMVALAQFLISAMGWRKAYVFQGLFFGGLFAPLTVLLPRMHPREMGLHPDGIAIAPTTPNNPGPSQSTGSAPFPGATKEDPLVVDKVWVSTEWTMGKAVRTVRFWAFFWANFLMWGLGFNLLISHQVAYMVGVGHSNTLAASVVGVYGIANILGNLNGFVSDRIGRERAYTLGTVGAITAVIILILAADPALPWLLYLYAPLLGLSFGIMAPTGTAAVADLFQGKSFGAIVGLTVAGFGIGGAVGPWLGGFIFDMTGSYLPAFTVSITAMALASGLIWLAAPRKVRLVSGMASQSNKVATRELKV